MIYEIKFKSSSRDALKKALEMLASKYSLNSVDGRFIQNDRALLYYDFESPDVNLALVCGGVDSYQEDIINDLKAIGGIVSVKH